METEFDPYQAWDITLHSPLSFHEDFSDMSRLENQMNSGNGAISTPIMYRVPSLSPPLGRENYSSSWSIHTAGRIGVIPWFQFREHIQSLHLNGILDNHVLYVTLAQAQAAYELSSNSTTSLIGSDRDHRLQPTLRNRIPCGSQGQFQLEVERVFSTPMSKLALHIAELAVCLISNNIVDSVSLKRWMLWFLLWMTNEEPEAIFIRLFKFELVSGRAALEKFLESIAESGDVPVLMFLLDAGLPHKFLAGQRGLRLLQIALSKENIAMAEKLIEFGPTLDHLYCSFAPFNESPFILAARIGACDVIEKLLEAASGSNQRMIKNALQTAVVESKVQCVRTLLQAGIDVDQCRIRDQSVLDHAYIYRKTEIYTLLLQHSIVAKKVITLSGTLDAASRGLRSLSCYINGRNYGHPKQKQQIFEKALSHAVQDWTINPRAFNTLLDFGVDPSCPTLTGKSYKKPLLSAISDNEPKLVALLLSKGVDVNTPDALYCAAKIDSLPIIQLLIDTGADIEQYGTEALSTAICHESYAVAKYLIKVGADIHERDENGRFIVQVAAEHGSLASLKWIVEAGANINSPPSILEGYTALHFAAKGLKLENVRFLLEKGAHVDTTGGSTAVACHNPSGETILEACVNSYDDNDLAIWDDDMVRLLLEAGAPVNNPCPIERHREYNSLLTVAIQESAKEVIPLILERGANVNQQGCGMSARTPVQAAAEMGDLSMVKELVRRGADINAPPATNCGRTALQAACSADELNIELIHYLIELKADINAEAGIDGGVTALQGAAIQGYIDVATILLEHGADVNAEAAIEDGRTVLEGAAEYGRLDMIQLLVNHGAKKEVKSAMNWATSNGHYTIVDLLAKIA